MLLISLLNVLFVIIMLLSLNDQHGNTIVINVIDDKISCLHP